MAPRKTRRKTPAFSRLASSSFSPIFLPDINVKALTLPLVKLEYSDGSAWYPLASEAYVNAVVPTLAVTSVGITGSTGLSVSGSPVTGLGTISLTLDTDLQGLSGLTGTGLLTRLGSGNYTERQILGTSGQINVANGNALSGNPLISLPSTGVLPGSYTNLNATLDAYGRVTSASNGSASSLDINTGTTGQLNISRLNGYPTNSSYFLRGDGIWTTPTFSSIDINSGTTGQLNISRLSGYPTSSNAFLRGDGTWILPYVNNLNINGNVSLGGYQLVNVGSPFASTDGTNKNYVDTKFGNITFSANTISASTGSRIQFGQPVWMSDLGFWLRGYNDSNHGMIFDTSINGIQFRGYEAFSWNTGVSGGMQVMTLNSSGTLGLNNLSALSSPVGPTTIGVLSSINMNGNNISNVGSPFASTDGTNKNYVDTKFGNITFSANTISASTGSRIQFGQPVWMSDLGFWLRGYNDSNHGMIFDTSINGIQFRGYEAFSWNTGVSGGMQVMTLNSSGTLGLNNLSALSSPVGPTTIGVLSSINMNGNNISNISTMTANGNVLTLNSALEATGSQNMFVSSYGYLNSQAYIGLASGFNPYSVIAHQRISAAEFNAISSQKIKRVSKKPIDIENLRQKFLDISFKSYQYLDPFTGQGDHYGIIAEDLIEHFPQFVDEEHERYVPNCLKLMSLTKIEGLNYFFTHDFDLSAIDPKSQKIKIVMGDSQVDTTIVTLTKQTLQVIIKEQDAERVKAEHHKNHYFAYGTYEKCPAVSKNKLFEVGLILLQDVLRERKEK